MFPDMSELIRVMKEVVNELQNSQRAMEELSQKVDKLTEALEV